MNSPADYPHCFEDHGDGDFRSLVELQLYQTPEFRACCYCLQERHGRRRAGLEGHGPHSGPWVAHDRAGEPCSRRYELAAEAEHKALFGRAA